MCTLLETGKQVNDKMLLCFENSLENASQIYFGSTEFFRDTWHNIYTSRYTKASIAN